MAEHLFQIGTTYLCSFGKSRRQGAFNRERDSHPMVCEMGGCIFNDYPECQRRTVDTYREEWMPTHVIGVRGDKGQVASLMRKPTLLFDDKIANLNLLHARSRAECPLQGVRVRRGPHSRRHRHGAAPLTHYCEVNDCGEWPDLVRTFAALSGQIRP